ncbi:hypothetical protein CAOG_06371, partial [Capsaspora owczarzaki ATCC 30864]|uniref:HIT domain-containing protein n=1 Tax=Capsaspora owczarzaki (strain ATCC 30864) TaxID=595528 RepID=A0A0D2WTV4_CAPO3
MSADCVFCRISSGQDPSTTLLFENERLVAFRDIRPAAPTHLLVVPKQHIRDATLLDSTHSALVHEMNEVALKLLADHSLDGQDARIGFHWPPLVMIKHLHLHVIAPASQMSFLGRWLFWDKSPLFSPIAWMLDKLA